MEEPLALDDLASWPPVLQELADECIQLAQRRSAEGREVEVPQSLSNVIDHELSERGILVHQCSRLLAAEVRDIRENGLRATSSALLADKVEAAVRAGFITRAQAELIMNNGVLTSRDQLRGRNDAICALTTLQAIGADPEGVRSFFEYWGGEITYFWQLHTPDTGLRETLRSVGEPALITFVHHPQSTDVYAPDLSTVVVDLWRNRSAVTGEVHIRIQPGTRLPVTTIAHPGDPWWPAMVPRP
ncbi:hypothetical protein DK926_19665 [Rhodococcus sp. Eu-32]|uniref:hypothetical protein n=1 Tax=Rhodococcus sp. Eu-32 TaxID=1017319 RepID=UPI000F79FB2D|nr:hypothetical protein [Rhodococcus sp. Eu-32]RRQ26213.1 hypothetical protein DK926_19665 [Rhodococcus sp. Eu-32]